MRDNELLIQGNDSWNEENVLSEKGPEKAEFLPLDDQLSEGIKEDLVTWVQA